MSRLYILSGPSGVGKDTVVAKLMARRIAYLVKCVTATTRSPRGGEEDGKHYFFLSREEFETRIVQGLFLEHAEYNGHLYGTPKDFVEDQLTAGNDVLLIVEVQGAAQIMAQMPQVHSIFLMPPAAEELERRLRERGTDDEPTIMRRMALAREEMSESGRYSQVIVNRNIERAVEEIMRTLTFHRLIQMKSLDAPNA